MLDTVDWQRQMQRQIDVEVVLRLDWNSRCCEEWSKGERGGGKGKGGRKGRE